MCNKNFSCCFTGYRPSKFPFMLDKTSKEYLLFDNFLIKSLTSLIDKGCNKFFTGMAMGFDILAAEAVVFLKKAFSDKDIKLICVLPFENQEKTFSGDWQERYNEIIKNSNEVIVLSNEYYKGCYQNRNIYMVDNSDYILTWYDGKQGGTRNTLKYAEKNFKYIININTNYIEEFNNSQIKMDI